MGDEGKTQENRRLSLAERINLFIGLLAAFIGLISSLTSISPYLKLLIAALAVGIGAIALFLSREAWRRLYIWLGPLSAATVAGLLVGALVLPHSGNPFHTPTSSPAPRATPTPKPPGHSPGPAPDPGTVTVLMDEEVAAALDNDILSRIYAPNAVVKDAACQTRGRSVTWTGLNHIKGRYQHLPAFSSLRHVPAEIRWQPDNSLAAKATVTAQTVGVIKPSTGSPQYIHGNEVWTFARVGGRWVITSFTYNVCFPP